MRVLLESAFILHSRPYGDTSLLLDIFSYQYGRLSLIAKGVRKAKSSRRAILQPFIPVRISWTGRSDLKTLTDIEWLGHAFCLKGDAAFNGIYLNELLVKLLYIGDPHPELFEIYQQTLQALVTTGQPQKTLRFFEYQLLENLGYGLHLESLLAEDDFQPQQRFLYKPGHGFEVCAASYQSTANPIICGHCLLQLLNGELLSENCTNSLKQLMRVSIHYLLDGKDLKSRDLYKVV